MEQIDLPDWDSFEVQLNNLRADLTANAIDKKCPDLLFRGQSDSEWQLTTTLERAGCKNMSFDAYYRQTVTRVRPTVETFTGEKWNAPDYSLSLADSFRCDAELFSIEKFPDVEFYRYLVYLRHHGFPSPLLDWTASAKIATFFAFREAGKTQARSIYVYCERPMGSKGGAVGAPAMRRLGPYVRSHPRHFRQRSDYTICASFDPDSGWHFYPHDQVFGSRGKQDFLWKFTIPTNKRIDILRRMEDFNLNAFSLFDTEETLLETMWLREHELRTLD